MTDTNITSAPKISSNSFAIAKELREITSAAYGLYQMGDMIKSIAENEGMTQNMLIGCASSIQAICRNIAWNNVIDEIATFHEYQSDFHEHQSDHCKEAQVD